MNRARVRLAGALAGILWAGVAFGGISILDEQRTLHIRASQFDQTLNATPLTAFDQTLQNSYTDPYQRVEQASATQNSSIELTGGTLHIKATGQASFLAGERAQLSPPITSQNEVFTESSYSIQFMLDTPATYTITQHSSLESRNPPTDLEMAYFGAELVQGQTNLLPVLFSTQGYPLTYKGTLTPGTYTLKGNLHGNGINLDSGDANFTLDFVVSQNPGGVSPSASSVPLPPAFWLAVPVIGGLTLLHARRRHRPA